MEIGVRCRSGQQKAVIHLVADIMIGTFEIGGDLGLVREGTDNHQGRNIPLDKNIAVLPLEIGVGIAAPVNLAPLLLRNQFDMLAKAKPELFGMKKDTKRPYLKVRSWLTALKKLSLLMGTMQDGYLQHDHS